MIEIKTDAKELRRFLSQAVRKQIPFATSRAINGIAYDAKDREQAKLGQYFKIRTKWLTKRGAMPVVRSDKKQYPDIHAILGVKDEVAALNITGGKRQSAQSSMAVPLSSDIPGLGKTTRQTLNPGAETLTKKTWPSKIVKKPAKTRRNRKGKKPTPFFLQSGAGKGGVFIRKGDGTRDIKALYLFKSSVTIRKTWPLVSNVRAFVAGAYTKRFNKELENALRRSK